jgi:hypothetical protein
MKLEWVSGRIHSSRYESGLALNLEIERDEERT